MATIRKFEAALQAYKKMCGHIGISFSGETQETPRRVVQALIEMTRNVDKIKKGQLDFKFTTFESKGDCLGSIGPIFYSTLCEHHMWPFFGVCFIGYLPAKKIGGLSKFPRLIEFLSGAPTTQERFTNAVADSLEKILEPQGVIVHMQATHTCVCSRGPKSMGCQTITTALRGKASYDFKDEFLAGIR